jgi:hypothetical protein
VRNTDEHGLTGTNTLSVLVCVSPCQSVFPLPLYDPTLNSTPWARGRSVPQLRVQVWRRM